MICPDQDAGASWMDTRQSHLSLTKVSITIIFSHVIPRIARTDVYAAHWLSPLGPRWRTGGLCDTVSMLRLRRLSSLLRVDKIEVEGEGETGGKKVVRV